MERRDEKCDQSGNGALGMEKAYGFNDEPRLTTRPVLFSRKMTRPERAWLPSVCGRQDSEHWSGKESHSSGVEAAGLERAALGLCL